MKCAAYARFGFNVYAAAMPIDNRIAGCQAKAMTSCLCRIERIKDTGQNILRNTNACIFYGNHDVITTGKWWMFVFAKINIPGRQNNSPAVRHCLFGIDDDVVNYLADLVLVK